MAPASIEDQFTFLISCIRHNDNGKIDFQEVADECNVVSKGAAAKRYERMMKAHGIHQSQTQTTARNKPAPSLPRDTTTPNAKITQKGRKRKGHVTDTDFGGAVDDDEDFPSSVKSESNKRIKLEDDEEEHIK